MLDLRDKIAFVIFSVYRSERTDTDNENRHTQTLNLLHQRSIPYKTLEGSYKGTKEKSILIPKLFESMALMLSRLHDQDCYMFKPFIDDDATYSVVLHKDSSTDIEYIGEWTEVTKEVALSKEGYTYNPDTELYYTCINVDALNKEV